MRVVRNIEPRVVTEQQRRVFDTFIRPTINEDKRMFELADTLNKIAPVIRNYKDEADQARYNKEVAEGYAASANFKPDEVPADRFYRYSSVNANEYAKRSRAFQHGVNIHEAEALANTLPTAADEWFRTQSYNGRRIFEIDDPVQFNEAYRSFIRQYIQGETGGSMDPQIYQKYLQGPISQTEHNVTQQFLSERRKYMENRASSAFTRAMNSSVFTTFRSDAYFDDRDKWKAENIPVFVAQSIALSNTIGDTKAGNVASNLIDSYIADASSENELNDLLAMAKANPLIWDNAENQKQINKAVRYQALAIRQQEQRELTEARRVAKERQYEERAERLEAADKWNAEHPDATFEDFKKEHPDLTDGQARQIWVKVNSPYKAIRKEKQKAVLDNRYSSEQVDKLYRDKEIDKYTYDTYQENKNSAYSEYANALASSVAKQFLPSPSEAPELQYMKKYIKTACMNFSRDALDSLGITPLIDSGKHVPPEKGIEAEDYVTNMMKRRFPGVDPFAELNAYRFEEEGFTITDADTAKRHYSNFLAEMQRTGNRSLMAAVDQGYKIIDRYMETNTTFPSYEVFSQQLRSYAQGAQITQIESFLADQHKKNKEIDTLPELFECLVLLRIKITDEQGDSNSGRNKSKSGTRQSGTTGPTQNAQSATTDGANESGSASSDYISGTSR